MLWLHVGPPKTGSSAIQAYLRERRDELAAAGLFYGRPLKAENPEAAAWREVGNGLEVAWWLRPERRPQRFSPEAVEQAFRQAFVSSDHPLSLISCEILAGAAPEALVRLRDGPAAGVEVGAIALARDVYGHALSSWVHAVKHSGATCDFAGFCRTFYEGPQARIFADLAQAFGRERVRLVHYDAVKDDIVAGFLHALGVQPPAPTGARLANRGLSPVEIEVAIACNRLHQNRDGLSLAISRAITSSRPDKGAQVPFDPAAAAILAERFQDEVDWINAAFFEGRPQLGIAPRTEESASATADVAPAQVWGEAVQALLAELDARTADLRRSQSEVQHFKAMEKRRRGEAEGARRLARAALELDPANEDARTLLAKLDKPRRADDA